jgi:hypothetical protein
MPISGALVSIAYTEQRWFIKCLPQQLQPDWHILTKAAG